LGRFQSAHEENTTVNHQQLLQQQERLRRIDAELRRDSRADALAIVRIGADPKTMPRLKLDQQAAQGLLRLLRIVYPVASR
jgi:hypothetical protein